MSENRGADQIATTARWLSLAELHAKSYTTPPDAIRPDTHQTVDPGSTSTHGNDRRALRRDFAEALVRQ